MCLPVAALAAAAAVVSAGGQIYSGMAANAQGKYQQQVAEQNRGLELRAQRDSIDRAETAQTQHYRRLSQALGEARVRNSAAGLDVGFGSAADLSTDISLIGYEDSATLAQNANKEVMGYDITAGNYRNEGRAARANGSAAQTAGFIGGFGTLLGAASQNRKDNASNSLGGKSAVSRSPSYYYNPKTQF